MLRSHESPRAPRLLYFDIDGTLVRQTFGEAKRRLANGRFERAVRAAGFDGVVCVSDAVWMAQALAKDSGADVHQRLLPYCGGTIQDGTWFRENVELVSDPTRRGEEIDTEVDWYFLDDWAHDYLARAHGELFARRAEREGRVLTCRPDGSGADVLQWLRSLRPERTRARRPAILQGVASMPGQRKRPQLAIGSVAS